MRAGWMILLPGLLMQPLAGQAQDAVDACELRQLRQGDGLDISAGAWSATCVAGRGCAVLGPQVQGGRLQLARKVDENAWRMVLSLPQPADAMAGVRISVDGGEAENLPGEFLEEQAGGRAVVVRAEVADVVLKLLRKAKRQVSWWYTTKGGAQGQLAVKVVCFKPVLRAAERQLVQMRAMQQLGR